MHRWWRSFLTNAHKMTFHNACQILWNQNFINIVKKADSGATKAINAKDVGRVVSPDWEIFSTLAAQGCRSTQCRHLQGRWLTCLLMALLGVGSHGTAAPKYFRHWYQAEAGILPAFCGQWLLSWPREKAAFDSAIIKNIFIKKQKKLKITIVMQFWK